MKLFKSTTALALGLWSGLSLASCPDFTSYYERIETESELVLTELGEIFEYCLSSSEFFALFGGIQLKTDRLQQALESLERALLLNPDNGGALVDYAEALLLDGQLFAAIEINEMLLAREDIPGTLRVSIEDRQQAWVDLTNQTRLQLELFGGFDTNLNGAPEQENLALTLSGEPILLALSDDYRAVEGGYLSTRMSGSHRILTPDLQHEIFGQIRSRNSNDSNSDSINVSGRYIQESNSGTQNRRWGVGVSHLSFQSDSIFTGTDVLLRAQLGQLGACASYTGAVIQHQVWHSQRRLDGVEAKATFGASCNLASNRPQQFSMETSVLYNYALNGDRLGGNRDGWQINLAWQTRAFRGIVRAQANHTSLDDEQGFNPLLNNNAARRVNRSSVLIQYREQAPWLIKGAEILFNAYHQAQKSNIELFEIDESLFEIGLIWAF